MVNIFPEGILDIIRFNDLSPQPYKDVILTIGNFDGVHLGHQAIIQRMLKEAKQDDSPLVVVTFDPNPAVFFDHRLESEYLSAPEEKEAMLLDLGVDSVITLKFDQAFANLSPKDFVNGLIEKLYLSVLVVGPDFAMGKDRQGMSSVLEEIAISQSFSIISVQPVEYEGLDVSSTRIRHFLDEGNVQKAAKLLGRTYTLIGTIVHGSDRGSRIGLPTANISYWMGKKRPAVGVYATFATLNNRRYQGITNVGYRPTFEIQSNPNIETHLLDFDGNIYGERLTLAFIDKIRDEQKFENVKQFLAQIDLDKAVARKILANVKTPPNLPATP